MNYSTHPTTFYRDKDEYFYHTEANDLTFQSLAGYNDVYNTVFNRSGGNFRVELWEGNYLNMGVGSEFENGICTLCGR